MVETSRDGGKTWTADKHHVPSFKDCEDMIEEVTVSCRNYRLFGVLAGVRDTSVRQLYRTRGFPKDASEPVTKDFIRWNGDAHTPSFLFLEEFKKCLRKVGYKTRQFESAEPIAFYDWQNNGYSSKLGYSSLVAYCDKVLDELKAEHQLLGDPFVPSLRLVFWFDN